VVAPPKADHDAVVAWLLDSGVRPSQIKDYRDALEVTATVAVMERVFATTFYMFSNIADIAATPRIAQMGDYSVPTRVAHLIDLVAGLSYFPIPHYAIQRSAATRKNVGADPVSVPQTLYNIYSYPQETVGSENNVTQGVIEFEQQCYAPSDLTAFGTNTAIKVQSVSKTVGPNQPSNPQLEASLDIEMVASADTEVSNWFWLEAGNNWLYEYAVHVFSTTTVPMVQSISYGWAEFDQCAISPSSCSKIGVNSQGYVLRVNAEFQKIATRGVSILVASGDSGANGRTDYYCTEKHLNPDYPACSPFVLSVGATQLNSAQFSLKNPPPACTKPAYKCMSSGTEVAVSYASAEFASGGGFSNYASMPSWQTSVVQAYLKSGVALPPASYFNASGRAYPDVAAIGSDVLIYQGGLQVVGGTSASSPTWASVASLLVAASYAKTGKPLGLLSPIIYQAAAASPQCFQDITVGDNKCTEQGCAKSCQGYLCTKGWDPVSGFGSPNVQCLINYISQQLDNKLKN